MKQRYLRRITSLRVENGRLVPQVVPWTDDAAIGGECRECAVDGKLTVPGPWPWLDQWNGVHKPEDGSTHDVVAPSTDGQCKPESGQPIIRQPNKLLEEWWFDDALIEEVRTYPDCAEVMRGELQFHRNLTVACGGFDAIVDLYVLARKAFYFQIGKPDLSVLRPIMSKAYNRQSSHDETKRAIAEAMNAVNVKIGLAPAATKAEDGRSAAAPEPVKPLCAVDYDLMPVVNNGKDLDREQMRAEIEKLKAELARRDSATAPLASPPLAPGSAVPASATVPVENKPKELRRPGRRPKTEFAGNPDLIKE